MIEDKQLMIGNNMMDSYRNAIERGEKGVIAPRKMEITKFGRVRQPHVMFFKTYGKFLKTLI